MKWTNPRKTQINGIDSWSKRQCEYSKTNKEVELVIQKFSTKNSKRDGFTGRLYQHLKS